MEIYFKNRFVSDEAPLITVHDRSFRFGDGVFETIIVHNSRLFDWPRHERRLKNGLEYFGIALDISKAAKTALELIKRNNIKEGYIRIIVSRGDKSGGLGYKPTDAEPYIVIQTIDKKLPEFNPSKLMVSSTRAFYKLPSKVNSALHYVMALKEAAENGCDNALLLDAEGNICESATSNIFWAKDNILYTPSDDLPFVLGTMREKILSLWKGEVREGRFKLDELAQADEIFLTNVGMLVSPVDKIKDISLKPSKGGVAKDLYDRVVASIQAI